MNRNRRLKPTSGDDTGALIGWLSGIIRQGRLTWRLLWDGRVEWWTKFIPPTAVAYVISPIDILVDIPPVGLNQLDDLAVLLLGVKLFIELAPPEVVREHLEELGARIEEWRVVDESSAVEGDYTIKGIEGQRTDVREEDAADVSDIQPADAGEHDG